MTIHQRCPKCFTEFDLPDEVAGKKIRCNQCNQVQTIPKPPAQLVKEDAPIELDHISQGDSSGSGNKMIPLIILVVLALPVFGFGSWAIINSMSGDSGSETSPAGADVGENNESPESDDSYINEKEKRGWAEAADEQHKRINSGKPFTPKESSVRSSNNPNSTNPGKINFNNPSESDSKPRRNRVAEIELGSIRLTDSRKLYPEVAALANAIALNWIYMYPEGQLASQGFPEIEHQKKVDNIYELADEISDQRLRRVVREAAQQLDLFPNEYTEIRGDASLEGVIVSIVGQQMIKAQFLVMNKLLEGLHRQLWTQLDSVLADLAGSAREQQRLFSATIPPVRNRGSSSDNARVLLMNESNQQLHDVIIQATFRDPWNRETTNWYYYKDWDAGAEQEVTGGIDWGSEGIARTVEVDMTVWSREKFSPNYTLRFTENFRDAVAYRLNDAEAELNDSGNYVVASQAAEETLKILEGPLDDPQLRSLAESLKQGAEEMKLGHDLISKAVQPNSELEGRWFFGKYSGDLGAKILTREESRPSIGLFGRSRRGGVTTSKLKVKIYPPDSPPTYKELHGFIGYSKARHSYVLQLEREYSSGLDRLETRIDLKNQLAPDTRQLLLKNDDRKFLFSVDRQKGWLVSEDTLGTIEVLVPKKSPDFSTHLNDLNAISEWDDQFNEWATIRPIPENLFPKVTLPKPLSEEYQPAEMKRMYAIPPGQYPQYNVSPIGFNRDKYFAYSVTGGKWGIFWDLEKGLADGTLMPGEGMTVSPDGKWLGRFPRPNLASMKKKIEPIPNSNMTAVAFSSDSKEIYCGTAKGEIGGWKVGDKTHFFEVAMTEEITTITADEQDRLFVAAKNNEVSCWKLGRKEAEFLLTYTKHQTPVKHIRISPDGKYALTIADENVQKGFARREGLLDLHIWEVETQKTVYSTKIGRAPTAFALSDDWRWMLIGEADNQIYLWDMTAGKEIARYKGHLEYVSSLAFSPSNKYAISGGRDFWVIQWGLPEDLWKANE